MTADHRHRPVLRIGRIGLHHKPTRPAPRAHHTGAPPTDAVTPVATAAAPAAVPWLVATGSTGRAGAGAAEAEGAGVVVLPSAR